MAEKNVTFSLSANQQTSGVTSTARFSGTSVYGRTVFATEEIIQQGASPSVRRLITLVFGTINGPTIKEDRTYTMSSTDWTRVTPTGNYTHYSNYSLNVVDDDTMSTVLNNLPVVIRGFSSDDVYVTTIGANWGTNPTDTTESVSFFLHDANAHTITLGAQGDPFPDDLIHDVLSGYTFTIPAGTGDLTLNWGSEVVLDLFAEADISYIDIVSASPRTLPNSGGTITFRCTWGGLTNSGIRFTVSGDTETLTNGPNPTGRTTTDGDANVILTFTKNTGNSKIITLYARGNSGVGAGVRQDNYSVSLDGGYEDTSAQLQWDNYGVDFVNESTETAVIESFSFQIQCNGRTYTFTTNDGGSIPPHDGEWEMRNWNVIPGPEDNIDSSTSITPYLTQMDFNFSIQPYNRIMVVEFPKAIGDVEPNEYVEIPTNSSTATWTGNVALGTINVGEIGYILRRDIVIHISNET